jgi:hypothetical protein
VEHEESTVVPAQLLWHLKAKHHYTLLQHVRKQSAHLHNMIAEFFGVQITPHLHCVQTQEFHDIIKQIGQMTMLQ